MRASQVTSGAQVRRRANAGKLGRDLLDRLALGRGPPRAADPLGDRRALRRCHTAEIAPFGLIEDRARM
jgi:hypothetical protein